MIHYSFVINVIWTLIWNSCSIIPLKLLNPLSLPTVLWSRLYSQNQPLLFLWTICKLMCLSHFLFHYSTQHFSHFKSRDEISLRGKDCNIPDVKKIIKKVIMSSLCIIIKYQVVDAFHVYIIVCKCYFMKCFICYIK